MGRELSYQEMLDYLVLIKKTEATPENAVLLSSVIPVLRDEFVHPGPRSHAFSLSSTRDEVEALANLCRQSFFEITGIDPRDCDLPLDE